MKCSNCAYAVYREKENYHLCRYPNKGTENGFVNPVGDWVPKWCPKIEKKKEQECEQK